MPTQQELRKRKPELMESLLEREPPSLRVENLRERLKPLAQARRAAKLKKRAGHWLPELMPV